MNSNYNTLKKLSFLAASVGLLCLLAAVVDPVRAQDDATAALTDPSITEPTAVLPASDELTSEEDEEALEEAEEALDGQADFMISLEDSLAQFVLRHRDVRRDCDAIQIDLQIQQQSGQPSDPMLQQEFMGCMNYKRELEENIMDLAARISRPGPPPASLPAELTPPKDPSSSPPSGGLLSMITKRLPGSLF